ncbi:hypothetical protein JB92DRAFT_736820 [Gautieria morchelliformis]|nr:hypothetical protein JB92DRAFT_736820 [Gautieria morchelliformis]
MNSLALELIDDIISHVDEKDDIRGRSHLRACSLVCRLWLPLSQRRLFHHIEFVLGLWEGRELYSQVQRLDWVLLKSPHLAGYIRVLELPDLSNNGLTAYYQEQRAVWIAIDEPLSSLMCKFTQVQKLKFSCLDWNTLPGYFRQSLRRVLELPSMAFFNPTRHGCLPWRWKTPKRTTINRGSSGLAFLTLLAWI